MAIPDQSIDLDAFNIVKLLQGFLDLPLVCLDIADEHKCVVLLNLFHRAFGVQRMDDDFVCIKTWFMRDGFAGVFGRSRELESLWTVEGRGKADFSNFVGVCLVR